MFTVSVFVFSVSLCTLLVCCVFNVHLCVSESLHGSPLFLTPLLEENKITEAQILSRIKPDIVNTTCFSGYFTVNEECESNLFFWFCQAKKNWEQSPVLLWLQGGPGGSSLFGLFKEIGPFYFKDGIATVNDFSWNTNNNLLFVDQPVGTGFSFTRQGCYAKDKTDIAKDVYSAIIQFYQLFPTLRLNKFYIAGESYAGHYIPYIAHYIHKMNPTAKCKVKLEGMMIGNGWMDAYYQYDYSDFLYYIGLIDEKQKEPLRQQLSQLRNYLNVKHWLNASIVSDVVFENVEIAMNEIDRNNFQKDKNDSPPYFDFVDFSLLRNSIHVGSQGFGDDRFFAHYSLVNDYVYDEIQSTKVEVEELLEHYPIVFYFGQLDTLCPYSVASRFLRDLRWSGTADYQHAPRHQWCVDGRLAGFYKSFHNLHEVLVRNAGHSVPVDQPLWAFILADSVTSSPPDDPLRNLTTC